MSAKKYFRDHFVLLLLTINIFFACFTAVFVTLRIISTHGNSYVAQYRPSLGLDSYTVGGVMQLLAFIVFATLVTFINTVLSYKVYKINRQLSIVILSLGLLLLVLTIIISNALLVLR